MNKTNYIFLLAIIFSFFCKSVSANDEIVNIENTLLSSGFENINVSKPKEKISLRDYYIISYENRTFLHEIYAIKKVLESVKDIIKNDSHLDLYIQSSGLNVLKISLDYNDYLDYLDNKISEQDFSEKIDFVVNPLIKFDSEQKNKLIFHSDLTFTPSYLFDPTKGLTLFASSYLETFLDNGFDLKIKYSLPFYNMENSFDFLKNFNYINPQFTDVYINNSFAVPNLPLYLSTRTGYISNYFSNTLYVSNDSMYNIFNGFFSLNLASGLSYDLSSKKTDFSVTPYLQIYYPKWDLLGELGGGLFLNQNYGFWSRLTRQFNNADLGFAVYRVINKGISSNLLIFEYRLAIGPENSITASQFRVTYPRTNKGSLYSGGITSGTVTSPDSRLYLKRLFPEYIKNHLYYLKESK